MFGNRLEAGLLLAAKLKKYKGQPAIILAVPRGGVPVAYAVAKELGLPLELILTKKIGHPMNKEYAIGAASLTDYFVIPHEQVSDEYIQCELQTVRNKLKEMHAKFIGDKFTENLEGKTVIIIDDGIATGNTLLGTIALLKNAKPAKIVIGVPVASMKSVGILANEVDEIITLMIPAEFYGVGTFYRDFNQVDDEEVMFYLEKTRALQKAG